MSKLSRFTKAATLSRAGALTGAGALAAVIRKRRSGQTTSGGHAGDPVHAPGHRHRKPPRQSRKPITPDVESELGNPRSRRRQFQPRRFRRPRRTGR